MIVRAAALLAVALLCVGCASASHPPALPQPISLVAADAFPLYSLGADAKPTGTACAVRRVEATIASVRGDTMFLNDVRVVEQPSRASLCPNMQMAMILPTRDTAVHAELRRASSGRTLVPLLLLASTALILFVRMLRYGPDA